MVGGMARTTPPTCRARPPRQSTCIRLVELWSPGATRGDPGRAGDAPPCRHARYRGAMVSGLPIWMPIKAVTGETLRRGGQGQDGHRVEGHRRGDAHEDSQGHAPGQFPGILLEAQEFQPVIAQVRCKDMIQGRPGRRPPPAAGGAGPCPPGFWATRTGTR